MTTLPQTRTTRLPQTGVPGLPASAAYAPSAAVAPPGAFQMSGADVWRVIRGNMWLIIIMAILFGAGGYFAFRVWLANWPSYTAVGLLEIRTEILTDPVADKIRDMSDARLVIQMRTQQQYLLNEALWSRVLQNNASRIRNTDWFKSFPDVQKAKKDLEDNFRVYPVPDTAVIRVSMTCSQPKDAATIIEEIINEHLNQEREKAISSVTKRNQALREMSRQYVTEIENLTNQIRTAQMTLASEGGGVEGMFSTLAAELNALMNARNELAKDLNEIEGQYLSTKTQLDRNAIPFEVQKLIDTDPLVNQLQMQKIRDEIQRDVQLETLGPGHKDIARFNMAVQKAEDKLNARRAELRIERGLQYLAMLEGMVEKKREDLKKIDSQISALKAKHVQLSSELAQLNLNKETVRDLNQQKQLVVNALNGISGQVSDPDSLMRINWYQTPLIPDMPSWPRLFVILPAAVVLGLGLALGIAFLREFLDNTVRSPRDISRVGQMNVLGIIADSDDDPQVANAKLPIFDAPHSLTAEQFRQVRTRLQHAAALDTTRSIMVTGPGPMDGKTTVAANLAAGLALNGRKILLVDANFRRPEIHRLFSINNERGFSDVLNGTAAFDECLHATRIPNLSIMPSGPKPLNVTELFESQLLLDFIERALEEFDHVIFDSAPFLVVSESTAMAPRVDGVVTVIRAHAESRGLLQRMRDGLKQVKAEHLGVVLNAVRAQGGGYYGRNIKTYYNYNNEA